MHIFVFIYCFYVFLNEHNDEDSIKSFLDGLLSFIYKSYDSFNGLFNEIYFLVYYYSPSTSIY